MLTQQTGNNRDSGPTKFFIAGVRRSGTTLIRTTLDNHPQIRCIGEAFHFTGRLNPPDGDKISYQRHLHAAPIRRLYDLLDRKGTVEKFLDSHYNDAAHQAVGFKLMITHARNFPSVMKYLHRHQVRCIHVLRRNVLKTLISRAVKKETRLAHSRNQQKVKQIELQADRLLQDLEKIDHSNGAWNSFLEGLPILQVVYEDFARDNDAELRRMCEFLGVEHLPDVRSSLVKVNPNEIQKILLNYDEVCEVLRGTRFEWCLAPEDAPAPNPASVG